MFGLEFAKLNTLMKLAVVDHYDWLARPGTSRVITTASQAAASLHAFRLHDNLIINSKLALGHPGQVGLHHDLRETEF